MPTHPSAPPVPTFKEALRFWLKLGFISFGGPAGQISIMHEFLVEKRKWISESRFLHALNYCMLLPGPEAQQLATYVGWLLHGVRGGVVAGLLFVLPSLFMLFGLSVVYVQFGQLPIIAGLLYGLKPAVVAIVILALVKIGKKSLLTPFHLSIATASFILIFFFSVTFPLIVLLTVAVGSFALWLTPSLLRLSTNQTNKSTDESGFYLNHNTPPVLPGIGYFIAIFVTGCMLWGAPFLLYALSAFADFWTELSLFFTKAALVTFGGAYAVLPYVAQVSVENFHWLTAPQMVDGLALGESTPGPLIMVLTFVGFMAGYQQGGTIMMAAVSLLITAYYTFLPSFLFILGGAPLVESTHHNARLKQLLSVVTAAVVGVVLNLALYFGRAVIVLESKHWTLDFFALTWTGVSLIFLHYFKLNMILWIAISAVGGLIYLSI